MVSRTREQTTTKSIDDEGRGLLADFFGRGEFVSIASRAERARIKAAARATAIKDRRVNIRLSSGDLSDIQARAMEEGVPYQTLIASVLHTYVTGRLCERVATIEDAGQDEG